MRDVKLDMRNNEGSLDGIGETVESFETVNAFLRFGKPEYLVALNIIPASRTVILSRNEVSDIGLNYHAYHKIIKLLKDGYSEPVQIRNSFLFGILKA